MIGPTTFSILPKIPSLCLLSWHNYEKQPLSSSKMFQFTNSMVTVLIYTLNLFQFLQIWRWQIPTEYVEFSTVFVTWQTLILSQIIWVSLLPQRSWGETSLHFHRVYKYLMSKLWEDVSLSILEKNELEVFLLKLWATGITQDRSMLAES